MTYTFSKPEFQGAVVALLTCGVKPTYVLKVELSYPPGLSIAARTQISDAAFGAFDGIPYTARMGEDPDAVSMVWTRVKMSDALYSSTGKSAEAVFHTTSRLSGAAVKRLTRTAVEEAKKATREAAKAGLSGRDVEISALTLRLIDVCCYLDSDGVEKAVSRDTVSAPA